MAIGLAMVRDADPPHRCAGTVESATLRGERATARCEDICNRAIRPKLCTMSHTKAVRRRGQKQTSSCECFDAASPPSGHYQLDQSCPESANMQRRIG